MDFNVLDYIILMVLALSILLGYQRGLIRSLGGIVSTLAGLGIAFIFRYEAANYLEEHFALVSDLTAYLEKRLLNTAGIDQPPAVIAFLPVVSEGMAALHREISEFTYLFVVALCFLLLYFISSQLLKISCLILERILHWGIIGRMNRLGGSLIMFAQNTAIMAVLAGVLISPLGLGAEIGIKSASQADYYMQSSYILPYLLKAFALMQAIIGKGV